MASFTGQQIVLKDVKAAHKTVRIETLRLIFMMLIIFSRKVYVMIILTALCGDARNRLRLTHYRPRGRASARYGIGKVVVLSL